MRIPTQEGMIRQFLLAGDEALCALSLYRQKIVDLRGSGETLPIEIILDDLAWLAELKGQAEILRRLLPQSPLPPDNSGVQSVEANKPIILDVRQLLFLRRTA